MRHDRLTWVVFVPIGLYLALMLSLAAFVVHPPLLGWIGLALAATIAIGAATTVIVFLSRMRTNVVRLHPHAGHVYKLLVVSDVDVEPAEIASAVTLRTIGRHAEIRVVAPTLPSTLHFFSADEERETSSAAERLRSTLAALASAGITVHGTVGTDDPLQAVGDVLLVFPADEILLVGSLSSQRSWSDWEFERRARDLFGVPVSTVFGRDAAQRDTIRTVNQALSKSF